MNMQLNKGKIHKGDYNFIISNIILNQKDSFTYYSIKKDINNILSDDSYEVERVISQSLIRLRDDGFLEVLGSNYWVVD